MKKKTLTKKKKPSSPKPSRFKDEYIYKTLIDNLPQKIFLKDKDSVYVSCNMSYANDLKIRPDEIVGKTDFDFYPKELAEKYRRDDEKTMRTGKAEDIEEQYIEGGKELFVHTVKVPVKNDKWEIIGVLGIFWDVTERKAAEDQLKARNQELEKFYDLTVERENKLIELKKNIRELEEELRDLKEIQGN